MAAVETKAETVTGIMKGTLSFGKYFEVPFAEVDGLEYRDVCLLGRRQGQQHYYRGRRVEIPRGSIVQPDQRYGILGTREFIFPDATQDISPFHASIDDLTDVNVEARHNVIDTANEDSFLYAYSPFDIDHNQVFFLRLTKYTQKTVEQNVDDFFNTPYSSLGRTFKADRDGFIKGEIFIHHYAKHFWLKYSAYTLPVERRDKFFQEAALARLAGELQLLPDNLAQALADPRYMEALCRRIELKLRPKFKAT